MKTIAVPSNSLVLSILVHRRTNSHEQFASCMFEMSGSHFSNTNFKPNMDK